jgi:hypothetical protein
MRPLLAGERSLIQMPRLQQQQPLHLLPRKAKHPVALARPESARTPRIARMGLQKGKRTALEMWRRPKLEVHVVIPTLLMEKRARMARRKCVKAGQEAQEHGQRHPAGIPVQMRSRPQAGPNLRMVRRRIKKAPVARKPRLAPREHDLNRPDVAEVHPARVLKQRRQNAPVVAHLAGMPVRRDGARAPAHGRSGPLASARMVLGQVIERVRGRKLKELRRVPLSQETRRQQELPKRVKRATKTKRRKRKTNNVHRLRRMPDP